MSPEAEIVASLLRWAQNITMIESLRGTTLPGPRAPGCPLGRLIKREDVATALAIVMDMNPEYQRQEEVALLVEEAQASMKTAVRSRQQVDSNEQAEAMLSMLSRYYDRRTREFMLVATRAVSWKSLEGIYPGRDWSSLRDDFESHARQLWRSEKFFLSHLVDFVVKLG